MMFTALILTQGLTTHSEDLASRRRSRLLGLARALHRRSTLILYCVVLYINRPLHLQ